MRIDDLHGPEAERFHRRDWRVERVGWALLLLIAIAALLGLFGSAGPLNQAEATAGPLAVRYRRFLRHSQASDLVVELRRDGPGPAELWIERGLLRQTTLDQVTPQPSAQSDGGDRVVLAFDAEGPLRVQIRFEPEGYWSRRGRIGSGEASVEISQFIYP